MTLAELAYRMAVLLAGDDTPELRAQFDAFVALNPPPPTSPFVRRMTVAEFNAHVDACGGAEAVRRSALRYYGVALD